MKNVTRPTNVVILVPFSSDDETRVEVWRYVKRWLEITLGLPIHVGADSPGPQFNLSLARNRAAKAAGDWDVAVIQDADTVVSADQVLQGIQIARETGAVVYPYTERWELDAAGTKLLMDDIQSDWQSHASKYVASQPLGGCIIITRELWDLVGGFDTGFVGWGHEDGAFALACEVLGGHKLQRVPGRALHLEHNPQKTKSPDSPEYVANRKRMMRYAKAQASPDAVKTIRQLQAENELDND